ncbi:hypothetical protein [Photobacterium leiognathi]|uniref:hypothetical protein n=1 Tax=Photobacterium leiognathi TaxID=553611 RepID=UPI000D16F8D7|nr:hypothetical protein [Photobacterium leiognathi]PSW56634.1 hypothetical protein C0W50_12665 [Photobacterium leiognathi subsp. mandapamensis]
MNLIDGATLVASFMSSILLGALVVFINKKAKSLADRTEFKKLKKELTENTTIIEKVRTDFLEANTIIVENVRSEFLKHNTEVVESVKSELQVKGWVNQQVWLKKQEIYESIFNKLLSIKKYTTHQSSAFQEALYLEREHEYYLSQGDEWIDSPSLKKDLERKREEYEIRVNSQENINESKKIRAEKEQAISSLMELASINSVYIDGDVESVLDKLKNVLQSRYDSSDFDEVENYMYDVCNAVEKAIVEVKVMCKKELQIIT